MQNIRVYDTDFEEIAKICEDNNVTECTVVEALLCVLEDEKIDISEWL